MNRSYLSYLLIRLILFPFSLFPFAWNRRIGTLIGSLAFYFIPNYRKRALSNLALATTLGLDRREIIAVAKESFHNLAITCLEYAKLRRYRRLERIVRCSNPTLATDLMRQKKGVVFFCAHQANWELFFLYGTKTMPGVGIGKPIKNRYLYRDIKQLREKFGGAIIAPNEALKQGLRALRNGKFFGIIGDQSLPESRYQFDFFGRRAWTTPLPVILAYKARCPIVVATIVREKKGYTMRYCDPLWPDCKAPLDREINRLMPQALQLLEAAIANHPGQWLWQHNRWKQETANILYYRFRLDSLLIILPQNQSHFEALLPHLSAFRTLYPRAFLTFLVPTPYRAKIPLADVELLTYSTPKELFLRDFRFKLVFNFSKEPRLKRHFLRQSAFEVLDKRALSFLASKYAKPGDDFSLVLKKALSRPNTTWSLNAS
ncbi:MAG: hypothetical protein AAF443_00805 [Chlamydiota bacterium]